MNIALLVIRLVLGLGMAAHGSQKLFGWFGGHGLKATAGFFEQLGFRPGRLFATVAAVTELGSGILIATGLLGPIGPALLISVMIVAIFSVHAQHGFFVSSNGVEVPLMYASGALLLALSGPGNLSIDTLVGLDSLWTTQIAWVSLTVAAVGGILNLFARHQRTPHSVGA